MESCSRNWEIAAKKYSSYLWDHFLMHKRSYRAMCIHCSAIIICNNFDTCALRYHFLAKHSDQHISSNRLNTLSEPSGKQLSNRNDGSESKSANDPQNDVISSTSTPKQDLHTSKSEMKSANALYAPEQTFYACSYSGCRKKFKEKISLMEHKM